MPGEGVTHSLHLFRIVPEHFSLRPLMILQPNVIQLCMLAANPKADRIEPLELSPVCHASVAVHVDAGSPFHIAIQFLSYSGKVRITQNSVTVDITTQHAHH